MWTHFLKNLFTSPISILNSYYFYFVSGVSHHDDLMYIFYIKQFPLFKPNDPETRTVERLTSIWENFAKTGEPIPKNNNLFKNVTWKRFTPQCNRYLEIGNELIMRNGLINPREMKLWDRLFPLP